MSRRYKPNAAHAHFVYSVEEIMKLYGVSQNTVSNWRRHGLTASDAKTPLVFRGEALNRFHQQRRSRSLRQLRSGESKCFKCKAVSSPDIESVSVALTRLGARLAGAPCPDCGAMVQKILSETECDMLRNGTIPNTTEGSRDEGHVLVLGGIGITVPDGSEIHYRNDRILHQWLAWAGRFSSQTRMAHMAAIRDFEAHRSGKPFAQITPQEAASYRDLLQERGRLPKEKGGLSRSTLAHRASHVASFFAWLAKQSGHRHLMQLEVWFDLPKGFRAKADDKPEKPYPTLDEAERALSGLPSGTRKERRDRAIFATAFATGLREDALITLRRRHVDPVSRAVRQEGGVMRAKNGKSYTAHWFPRTEAFQKVLCAWIAEVDERGIGPEDALFPAQDDLDRVGIEDQLITPMKTAFAVDAVFKLAWHGSATAYTPHSARHTLARLGDTLCFTPQSRKAWSLNLGHETEIITEKHYGKMSAEEQAEVFERFSDETSFSVDELQLALDYHTHRVQPGMPLFAKAKDLARRYEDGSKLG